MTPVKLLFDKDVDHRIIRQELDRLNGVLFVDRLSPAKRDIQHRKLKKVFLDR